MFCPRYDPPQLDGVKRIVARYDYDANGSYIVNGTRLTALGKDATQTNYVFTVAEGSANVKGNKIDRPVATGLSYTIDPDLQSIANEPKVSTGVATQTLTTNRTPLNAIQDVVITAEDRHPDARLLHWCARRAAGYFDPADHER